MGGALAELMAVISTAPIGGTTAAAAGEPASCDDWMKI